MQGRLGEHFQSTGDFEKHSQVIDMEDSQFELASTVVNRKDA